MARVLITGASSFTGHYLAAELKRNGHEIIGFTHHKCPDLTGFDEQHVVDITDFNAVADNIIDIKPEKVVHLAAIAFVAHHNVDEMYRTNILGTRYLLEALTQLDQPPTAVLVVSSANIYGNAYTGSIDETMQTCPANDYGITKMAAEHVARLQNSRLPLIVTRPFNYTGVGQAVNFLVPKIVDHVRRREKVLELGNIDVARDFSDVRTVAAIYNKLLQTPAAIGETINVCSGRALTLRQIIEMVEEVSGYKFEIVTNPAFVRANDVKTLSGDTTKLTGLIGPYDAPPFADTLKWMLEAS